jgi:hypothetical protein
MKKLVIQNLKDAFSFGLSFNDLSEIENEFIKCDDYFPLIKTKHGDLEFVSANVCKTGKKTMYYKFIPMF